MHFGIVTPPVPGHIHPFGALGRELIERGHRVTVFHMADLEERIRREGLAFVTVGESDHPRGSLPESLAELGKRKGLSALRFTINAVAKTTGMMLRDAPDAMRAAGIGMILADQTEPAGCTIAERLRIPFITVCNALALNREPDVPPPFSPWSYRPSALARLRNNVGYAVSDLMTRPIRGVVARYRKDWGMRPQHSAEETYSTLAQISQLAREFDFPKKKLPGTFHYTGPLRKSSPQRVAFRWERLNGKPLIYASLGTLQNSRLPVFRCFAEACQGLDAQLVITHGGGLSDDEASSLPGNPIVVPYAPQLEILERASLTLTHAGLNTVLDALSCGVPMIAIPITYEQPAIAERVKRCGAGEWLPLGKLSVSRLQPLIRNVLADKQYSEAAARMADAIRNAGGVTRAAEIVTRLSSRIE